MKILHLEASPGWGGQEIRILREAEGMRARGHEILLGVMEGGKLIDAACKAGFTVYPLNFNKSHWPFTLFRILTLIWRHKIDLVNNPLFPRCLDWRYRFTSRKAAGYPDPPFIYPD